MLVTRHEDHAVFDQAFRLFWKSRELIEKMLAMFSPVAPRPPREAEAARRRKRASPRRMFEGHRKDQPPQEIPEIEVDARFTVSGNEVLRGKDFAQMTRGRDRRGQAARSPSCGCRSTWCATRRFEPIRAAAASIRAP